MSPKSVVVSMLPCHQFHGIYLRYFVPHWSKAFRGWRATLHEPTKRWILVHHFLHFTRWYLWCYLHIRVAYFNVSSQHWRLGSYQFQQQSYGNVYVPCSDRSRDSPPSGSFWLSLVAVVSGAIVVLHGCLRTFPTCGCIEGKPVLTW